MTIPLPLLAELATSAQRMSEYWSTKAVQRRKQIVTNRAGIGSELTVRCDVAADAAREEADDARSLLFELIDRKAKALRVFSSFPERRWDEVRSALRAYGRTPAVNVLGSYFAADGTFMNADGTRSIFDDVDE